LNFKRAAFDDKATEYTNEHYQNGTATIYGKKEGGSVVVTICISSARFNPNNFWYTAPPSIAIHLFRSLRGR
jgi:hypothetical protein